MAKVSKKSGKPLKAKEKKRKSAKNHHPKARRKKLKKSNWQSNRSQSQKKTKKKLSMFLQDQLDFTQILTGFMMESHHQNHQKEK